MGTRNPPPTGAGYAGIPIHGANTSGPGANQHDQSYFQQLEMVIGPGHAPLNPYQCCCQFQGQVHSKQCQEHNHRLYLSYLHHQPPLRPIEQTRPCPGDSQPPLQLRSDVDYEMRDVQSDINGGKIEEIEESKQPAPVEKHYPQLPEVTKVIFYNGSADSVDDTDTTFRGGHEQASESGSRNCQPHGGVYNPDGSSVIHDCCNTLCPTGKYNIPQTTSERKQGVIGKFMKNIWITNDHDEQQDPVNAERSQNNLRKEKEDLMRRVNEMQAQLEQKNREAREALRKKDDELRKRDEELRDARGGRQSDRSRIASLGAELQDVKTRYQNAVRSHDNQVASLTTKMAEYKAIADRLGEQLSTLEQSNSKSVGGTGAHKDSHAIPPNLVKSVFVVNEAAFACTKTFITFLKERKVFQTHVAMQSVPAKADERYRKYAVESYICSRLFAGFENDSYVDSLDYVQSCVFLPANCEESEFFVQHQDPEERLKRYVDEYDSLQKLGLQGVMDVLKTNKAAKSTNPFHQFCCRKLVNILSSLDGWFEEFGFLRDVDHSKHSVLHQLATNPKYCEKFLKPFVNLAMVAFLLHRLAFQFQPPARIFRYAQWTKFDRTYMENAVPIDDDDSDEEFVVGLMLVPGFQVGNTIVKCTVYLVPSSAVKTPGSSHAT